MIKSEKKIKLGWLSTGNGSGSLGLLKKGIELTKKNILEINYIFIIKFFNYFLSKTSY